MAERLERQTLNTEVPGSSPRRAHVSLFPWARNFTLIAPWFGSHVKPLVPCANAPSWGAAYSVYLVSYKHIYIQI